MRSGRGRAAGRYARRVSKQVTGAPTYAAWGAAVLGLGLLAWQGHRIAHLLPELEAVIEGLGPWGPLAYLAGVIVLCPLLVPDSVFAVIAGVAFGLGEGFALYFGGVYAASLLVCWLARHGLRARARAALAARPDLEAMARGARSQGARATFWIRLIPLNPAVVSYALGAFDVPMRAVAIGTFGMAPHMLLSIYLAATAAHVTRMAGASHRDWTLEGAALLLGLVACAFLVRFLTGLARERILELPEAPGDQAARDARG